MKNDENEVFMKVTFDVERVSERIRGLIDETVDSEIKGSVALLKKTLYGRAVVLLSKDVSEEPSLETVAGCMYSYLCSCLDEGKDIRKMEAPAILDVVRARLGMEKVEEKEIEAETVGSFKKQTGPKVIKGGEAEEELRVNLLRYVKYGDQLADAVALKKDRFKQSYEARRSAIGDYRTALLRLAEGKEKG